MTTRDYLLRLIGRETISPAAKKASDSIGNLGDRMKATADDSRRLDAEIDKSKASLEDLAVRFARTQDAAERLDLSKSMRKQQSELRKLTKAKDLLPDFTKAGAEAGTEFGTSLYAKAGPLLARLPVHPAVAGIGIGLAAAIAPMLGAAIGGAVLGGVATGGVIGGVVLAARDSRVKDAGKQLGQAVMGDLERNAARFVGPTIHGIGIIRSAWSDVGHDIDGIFSAASRYVEPLARGIAGALKGLAPGLRQAVEAAGPVVKELGNGISRIGSALGRMLSDVSSESDAAASGMRGLMMFAEKAIIFIGSVIVGLSKAYEAMVKFSDKAGDVAEKVWGWLPVLGDVIEKGNRNIDELKAGLDEAGEAGEESGDNIFDGLLKAIRGITGANTETKSLIETLRELREQTANVIDNEIAFERSLDEVAEAAKKAKGGIDTNTEAGRRNLEQLRGLHQRTVDYAQAIRERTGSENQAIEVTERGRKAFIANAIAMGVSKREAKDLATQLFGIPNINRKVEVETDKAQHNVKTLAGLIAAIKSKRVVITAVTRSEGRSVPIGDGIGGRASGGPIKAGTPYVVGEKGPELITPTRDGWVHDASKTQRMLAPKPLMPTAARVSVGSTSDRRITIDLTGADEEFKRFFRALLRKNPNLVVTG